MSPAQLSCLLHVDDLFIVGKRSWLLKQFVTAMSSEFECTWSIASEEDESISFLKRNLRVTANGVIVQAQGDLISKLCEVVGLSDRKTSPVPCSKEIDHCVYSILQRIYQHFRAL